MNIFEMNVKKVFVLTILMTIFDMERFERELNKIGSILENFDFFFKPPYFEELLCDFILLQKLDYPG